MREDTSGRRAGASPSPQGPLDLGNRQDRRAGESGSGVSPPLWDSGNAEKGVVRSADPDTAGPSGSWPGRKALGWRVADADAGMETGTAPSRVGRGNQAARRRFHSGSRLAER